MPLLSPINVGTTTTKEMDAQMQTDPGNAVSEQLKSPKSPLKAFFGELPKSPRSPWKLRFGPSSHTTPQLECGGVGAGYENVLARPSAQYLALGPANTTPDPVTEMPFHPILPFLSRSEREHGLMEPLPKPLDSTGTEFSNSEFAHSNGRKVSQDTSSSELTGSASAGQSTNSPSSSTPRTSVDAPERVPKVPTNVSSDSKAHAPTKTQYHCPHCGKDADSRVCRGCRLVTVTKNRVPSASKLIELFTN